MPGGGWRLEDAHNGGRQIRLRTTIREIRTDQFTGGKSDLLDQRWEQGGMGRAW